MVKISNKWFYPTLTYSFMIFLILGTITLGINQKSSQFEPKSQDPLFIDQSVQVSEPIIIKNNSAILPFNTGGDGSSWESSYIIENFEITAHNISQGLLLANISDYLIIRNFHITTLESLLVGHFESIIYDPDCIRIENCSNIRIENSTFQGKFNGYHGIGINVKNSQNIEIKNQNLFYNLTTAIDFTNVSNSIIHSGHIYQVYHGIDLNYINNCSFQNLKIDLAGMYGMSLINSNYNKIQNVSFTRSCNIYIKNSTNNYIAENIIISDIWYGICSINSSLNIFTNNNFTNNKYDDYHFNKDAIYLVNSSNESISGNIFIGWGIRISYSHFVKIQSNFFNSMKYVSINLRNVEKIDIIGNKFQDCSWCLYIYGQYNEHIVFKNNFIFGIRYAIISPDSDFIPKIYFNWIIPHFSDIIILLVWLILLWYFLRFTFYFEIGKNQLKKILTNDNKTPMLKEIKSSLLVLHRFDKIRFHKSLTNFLTCCTFLITFTMILRLFKGLIITEIYRWYPYNKPIENSIENFLNLIVINNFLTVILWTLSLYLIIRKGGIRFRNKKTKINLNKFSYRKYKIICAVLIGTYTLFGFLSLFVGEYYPFLSDLLSTAFFILILYIGMNLVSNQWKQTLSIAIGGVILIFGGTLIQIIYSLNIIDFNLIFGSAILLLFIVLGSITLNIDKNLQ